MASESETQSGRGFASPEELRAYNEVEPGLAGRMIASSEIEAKHRRDLEMKALNAQIADAKAQRVAERLGQVFGLVIAVFTVGCGTYAAVHGAPTAGAIISATGLGGLVGAFIAGRRIPPFSVVRYEPAGHQTLSNSESASEHDAPVP